MPETARAMCNTTTPQRYFEDVVSGETLTPLAFPLTVYRLVVAAGGNRDFNAIHHNSEFAQASGAPEMYANNQLLQGMWERVVRGYIGLQGRIHSLRGFRMQRFNCVGDTVTVHGEVQRTWVDGEVDAAIAAGRGYAEIKLWSTNRDGISVGPGCMVVSLPLRAGAP